MGECVAKEHCTLKCAQSSLVSTASPVSCTPEYVGAGKNASPRCEMQFSQNHGPLAATKGKEHAKHQT